jgi:hypothetical protein
VDPRVGRGIPSRYGPSILNSVRPLVADRPVADRPVAGKRVWLKPGQRYLFGRVKKDGVFQAIDHKGVSRRQCVIEVDKVSPGDGSLLHAHSRLFVTDEGSKAGTVVNGKLLKGDRQELKGFEHHLKLGSYPKMLKIQWQPVCLSCYLTAKDKKQSDPLASKRRLMEPLDIKTVELFVSNQTTHVVATKRNTVPGLQALISAKHIVDSSYVDALVCAATPEDLEGEENLCPLERDFDVAWPDPLQYLPPKGREPTTKPSDSYLPDPTRENVFEDWTFVFLDPGQYESILPAIVTGHGKALLFHLKHGSTTADETVTYMRNTAGQKGFGISDEASISGGVVLVKPVLKSDFAGWCDVLVKQVADQLGQRHIDQAEFLDAILSNDAGLLKRAVSREGAIGGNPPPAPPVPLAPLGHSTSPSRVVESARSVTMVEGALAVSQTTVRAGNSDPNVPQSVQPVAAETDAPVRKRPRTRAAPVSRFKAFDDGFDIDAVPQYEPSQEDSVEPSTLPDHHIEAGGSSKEDESEEDNRSNGHRTKRRRSHEADNMDAGFLPAAAALKKRRLDLGQDKKKIADAREANATSGKRTLPKATVKKEIDIRAAARARREAEEGMARQDQDVLDANMEDVCVENLKNLAVVEEMTVARRSGDGARVNKQAGGQWDEAWNGRKNFKKFRRKGGNSVEARRPAQNVIVPLVEVKRKNYGIGEAYWASSADKNNNNSHTQSQSQPQIQTHHQTQTPASTDESTAAGAIRLQPDAAEMVSTIDNDRPGQTRRSDKSQPSQVSLSNGKGNAKRPASSAGSSKAGASKRQRTIRTKAASDSESDGELRFKFGSRGNPR